MTDADLQLSQLFHQAEQPMADPAFAERVLREVAAERRKGLIIQLALQVAGAAVLLGIAMTLPSLADSFAGLDLDLIEQAAIAGGLVVAAGVCVRPLLARFSA